MRIEILIGNSEEPLIFPLNKPKLTLGSGETCDIIVDAPNISRKHVQILVEGDNFYVVDQGSTNGTFINEERLVPGRRTEFTSFFPVRLGDGVLITLLSEDEHNAENDSELSFPKIPGEGGPLSRTRSSDESTQMISLAELRKAKTSDLVNRRREIKKKSTLAKAPDKKSAVKSKRKQEQNRMRNIQLGVVFLLGIAGYVNFFVLDRGETKNAKIGQVIPLTKPKVVEVVEAPSLLIPENELISKERLTNLQQDIKCTLDLEKYFCNTIYKANEGPYGAVQIGGKMVVIIDGDQFHDEARKIHYIPPAASPDGQYTQEEYDKYEAELDQIAGVIFLLRAIPAGIDYNQIKDLKITFGLLRKEQDGSLRVKMAIAILPEGIREFKRLFEEVHLQNVTKIGLGALEFKKKIFVQY